MSNENIEDKKRQRDKNEIFLWYSSVRRFLYVV